MVGHGGDAGDGAPAGFTEVLVCFGAPYRVPLVDAKNFRRLTNLISEDKPTALTGN